MDKIDNKVLVYLGLLLGACRVIVHLAAVKLKFDPGHFVDIFIFVYSYIWLLAKKPKHVYSILYLLFVNFIIAAISIFIYDSFVLIYRQPVINSDFFLRRSVVALNVFELSLLSSVFYYLTQSIFKKKWENQKIKEDLNNLP
jgi:hypothetical protein